MREYPAQKKEYSAHPTNRGKRASPRLATVVANARITSVLPAYQVITPRQGEKKARQWHAFESSGGSGEIRTHGRLAPSAVFKTAGLNHSPTLPSPEILTAVQRTFYLMDQISIGVHKGERLASASRVDTHVITSITGL